MEKAFPILFFMIGIHCFLGAQHDTTSLNQALADCYQTSDLPGFAVALVTADEVLYQKGFGFADKQRKIPYTPHTIQNIGSVSKTFIGVALMKAIEQGLLRLDASINDFLPFEVHNPYFPEIPITIRHLATHTSSIQDTKHYAKSYVLANKTLPSKEGMDKGLYHYLKKVSHHEKLSMGVFLKALLAEEGKWYSKKSFSKHAPGTEKAYSNVGATLVAYIIEVVTGEPFDHFTQKHILDPLQMEASGWSFKEVDMDKHATLYFENGLTVPQYSLITYPDGGLLTSIADLSQYLMEMIKGFEGNSAFLTPASFKAMLPGDEDESRAFWGMGKSENIGHTGSDPGVTAILSFNARSRIGYLIFVNMDVEENDQLYEQFSAIEAVLKKRITLLPD